MLISAGGTVADLVDALSRDCGSFCFFRAVSLLEEYFRKKNGDTSAVRSGRVRFSADTSTVFPQADIAGARHEKESVRLLLSFMGLLGASSPLPNYFSDYVARYPEKSAALADMCSLFNNRIYALFYDAISRHRFASAVYTDRFLFRLSCLAARRNAAGDSQRALAYAGILSNRRRSARGLAVMLSNVFGGIPVTVTQWVPRRAPVAQPVALGSTAALGVSTTLGTEILDRAGMFRVTLGPLTRDIYESFLDASERAVAVRALVGAYVSDPLTFDIEVTLAASELVPAKLGDTAARLGRTASLGRAAAHDGTRCVAYAW
ncbi:MAG: type VI secretion system baseplate subunit TssG [Chitinivibrionales bacterium]|nr:type VI secretion system baseplate subunit TssG [Chitinivibrionales bacterium]MBD3394004.1 type VI secretion system baseplate subunit TssG [Chitinivibrionales bacterium]